MRAGCRRGRGAHAAAAAGGGRHVSHRLRTARRAEGVEPQGRDAAAGHGSAAPVRRHRRVQSARGGAGRSEGPQAAGAAVPLHHPAGAVGRTDSALRGRAGGVAAQDAVARRHHAPGHEPAGVHAAAGGKGDRRAPFGLPCRGRGPPASGYTAAGPRTPSLVRGWCRKGRLHTGKRPPRQPPAPRARSTTRQSLSRPGRTASAGRGCSSECSTSTCSTARTAAPASSRSSRPSSSGR